MENIRYLLIKGRTLASLLSNCYSRKKKTRTSIGFVCVCVCVCVSPLHTGYVRPLERYIMREKVKWIEIKLPNWEKLIQLHCRCIVEWRKDFCPVDMGYRMPNAMAYMTCHIEIDWHHTWNYHQKILYPCQWDSGHLLSWPHMGSEVKERKEKEWPLIEEMKRERE